MKPFATIVLALSLSGLSASAPDNTLTEKEKADGWILLFDGKSLDNWMTDKGQPSRTPVEDGAINPNKCGGYLLVHKEQWQDYILALDFKISKGCNSGVFIRTTPLTPRPGKKSIAFNGIEVQIMDSQGTGFHDTGAIYDLVPPSKNAVKPVGEWNHLVITCNKNIIEVEVNGEKVARMDMSEWTKPNQRPDGSRHKFDTAWKDHPHKGYVGLQDHGFPCWFKNIKIKPL